MTNSNKTEILNKDDELTTLIFLKDDSGQKVHAVKDSKEHLELLAQGFKPTYRGF